MIDKVVWPAGPNSSDLSLRPKCEGCPRIQWGQICNTYLEPIAKWNSVWRECPFHPDTIKRVIERQRKAPGFVDPLKASKRGAKKR